jgi:asparagine synthase (glutamine-hydrolysing)
MCGIVGYFTLRGDTDPGLPRFVATARDRLAYRGPDDAGLYVSPDGRCVLGCRRLAIRDRSVAGRQPMANESGTVWAVCNGEIYNGDDLRRSLEDRGHRFRSRCDVEVIVHLFEEHGPDLVHHLDGMFSLVVYDVVGRRLFGARDRLGVKPMYYAVSPRRFAFASEPKALLALPDVSRQPRLEEVPSYLAFNCVPGPPTLHRDIEKLEPGTRFSLSIDGHFRRERFWTFPPSSSQHVVDIPPDALDEPLRSAVRKRTLSDVRVGAALSGGLDSALVVALMTEILGKGVPTFTIGFPGDEATPSSDLHHARIVAERFGTEHHELIIDANALSAVVDTLPELADDPIGAPSQAGLLHLASHAKRSGVTVLQVGEGSDEAFCGYAGAHTLCRLHARLSRFRRLLPPWFAALLVRSLRAPLKRIALSPSTVGSSDGTLYETLRRYARQESVYWGHGVLFAPPEQQRLFARQPLHANPYDRLRSRVTALEGFRQRPYADQIALTDMLLQLPERLLLRLDRASMRHGVEARVPYLDPEVIEAAFRLPPVVRTAVPKSSLRAYAEQKLPSEVLRRTKVGFPASAAVFLAPPILAHIRARVLAPPFLDLTGLAGDRIQELLAACESGRGGFSHLWSLYILSLWCHEWV